MIDFDQFDDKAPLSRKGVAAGFIYLFSLCAFVEGLMVLVLDWNLWAIIPMVVGGLVAYKCIAFACTPAAYKKVSPEQGVSAKHFQR